MLWRGYFCRGDSRIARHRTVKGVDVGLKNSRITARVAPRNDKWMYKPGALVGATISRPFIVWPYNLHENIFIRRRLLPPLTRSPSLSEGGFKVVVRTL